MARQKKSLKATNPRDRRTPPAHSSGLTKRLTTTKGTGRVARNASADTPMDRSGIYTPRKEVNKLMKAAYGPDWRPKGYKKRK